LNVAWLVLQKFVVAAAKKAKDTQFPGTAGPSYKPLKVVLINVQEPPSKII